MTSGRVIAECAHQMALIPVVYLGWRTFRGYRPTSRWWWLAGAFGISWLADSAADILPTSYGWVPSLVYPISQSAVIGAALLPRRLATVFLGLITALAIVAALAEGVTGPDLMLRAAAWLGIVGIVLVKDGVTPRLAACLIVYFGLGLAMWMVHVQWLIVATWYPYQVTRLLGLVLFCWAARADD